ncbi:MAG: MFS transporter, partial [Deltaproteobacteria bacterium]|nr:MFS transporter [Deltaproteobacteria bacterium]
MTSSKSLGAVVLLMAAVQFMNILDFMMVMPLGPDFAKGLAIPLSHLGYIGGAYTLAAAIGGVAGSFFLDRFDRRTALLGALVGLTAATALGGFATSMTTLMAARMLAGLFGGPSAALALAVVSDVVPPERRGRAMGLVMSAFSVASVLGVPAGLELSTLWGWRFAFFGVAGIGLLVAGGVYLLLPSLRGHMAVAGQPAGGFWNLMGNPLLPSSLAMAFVVMMGGFLLIPNL